MPEISNMVEKKTAQFSFLAKLLNGGIAGIIGVACIFPLDLVKTRLQNQPSEPNGEKMYHGLIDAFMKTCKTEGFFGMYRGSAVTVIFVIPEKASVLAANDVFRYYLQTEDGKLPMYRQMIAGGLAGFCSIILTTPAELLKIRMQSAGRLATQARLEGKTVSKTSARVLAMEALRQNGIFGLYKGVNATMLRDITFSMIHFPLFATINAIGPKRALSDESVFWWSFLSGCTSGAFSGLIVTPFDVVKTRIQAIRRTKSEVNYAGIGDAFVKILKIEGPKALFKGGGCRMLVIAPVFGITQAVYYIGITERLLGIQK